MSPKAGGARMWPRLVTDEDCQSGQVELIEKISCSKSGCVSSGTVGQVTRAVGDWLVVRFYLSALDGKRGTSRLFVVERREVRRVDCSLHLQPVRPAAPGRAPSRAAHVPPILGSAREALRIVPAMPPEAGVITHESTGGLQSARLARELWKP